MEADQYDDVSYNIKEEQTQVQQPEQPTKPKSTKPKKTKKPTTDDDVSSEQNNKNLKGIILSITKPSYTLKGNKGRSLRSVHKQRLWYLFRQLVRDQNWDEVSGVLSVLLKATRRNVGLWSNRRKYSATLELLEHMGVAKVKPRKIHQVYEIWMKKDIAVTKNKRSPIKGSFDVQLEFILFLLSRGNNEWAKEAVVSVLKENNVISAKANLVVGLAFSQLWYNPIQEEMQLQDSLESSSPIQSGTSGTQQNMSIDQSNGQSAVEVQDSGSHSQLDSNTSIRFGKVIDPDEVVDRDANVKMEVDFDLKTEIPEYEDIHMNSVESDESDYVSQFPHTGDKQFGSVFYARDLETFLLPFRYSSTTFEDFVSLQKKIKNDEYKAAVKHLQNALHSTPPAFEALLPLIQMLLLGDQVKEAIEEVESVVQSYKAAFPFRLKASLLEHFSKEDVAKLCICYEDTLKKDPTCSHSLAKLINLHYDGFYRVEKLVEMIAWHLDATYADSHIWKEFASCFIRLAQCDEDRMSSCVNSYGDSCTERVKNVPNMFKDNVSRKIWRLRCRCWLTRHFTQTILASEVASGNMELLAYKAAAACHLYGPESKYVVKACKYLKKEKSQERSILKMHMKNAIGFYAT